MRGQCKLLSGDEKKEYNIQGAARKAASRVSKLLVFNAQPTSMVISKAIHTSKLTHDYKIKLGLLKGYGF